MSAQRAEAPSRPARGLVGANEVMGANAGRFRSAVEHLVGSRDKSGPGAAANGRRGDPSGGARRRPTATPAAPASPPAPSSPTSDHAGGVEFGPDHVATCQMIFTILAQDGLLEVDQLRTAITALGVPPSRRVMQEVQNSAPLSVFPRVGLETFITAMRRHLAREPVPTTDIRAAIATVSAGAGGSERSAAVRDARAEGSTASLGAIRHALCGVHTSNRTHLSERDADDLLRDLGYSVSAPSRAGDSPRSAASALGQDVDVDSFVAAINSGFARLAE